MTYYNSIASGYDELYKEEQLRKFEIIKSELPKKNIKLLDVGCGTFFSYDFFDCDVYGVEPSEKMIIQHPKHESLLKEGKLFVSPAENLCKLFDKNSFDVVICVTSAHHFSDFKKAFDCIKMVSKKDSLIVFSLLKSTSYFEINDMIMKEFKIKKQIGSEKDVILFCTQYL